MARPQKKKGGRVTPKGTSSPRPTPTASGRYTPPDTSPGKMPSPMWVPVLMFGLLGLGTLIIMLNYIDIVLPGAPSNTYLLVGLAGILGGIITATQYR